MGSYGGPDIVQDGLTFAIDAGSTRSYPGSGTAVTDLVGTNNGTLTNDVGFSSGNGGAFTFDGVDQYISQFSGDSPAGSFSISSWVYKEGTSGWYAIFSQSTQIWFGLNNNGRILAHVGGPIIQVTGAVDINKWHQCVLTYDGTTGRIYVDGTQVVSGTNLSDPAVEEFDIGRLSTGGQNFFYGEISQLLLYDGKALTTAEITQNYNAQKNRFI